MSTVNDSPLRIELFAPQRFDDDNDTDDPDKSTFDALKELSKSRSDASIPRELHVLDDAALASLVLRPGDVIGGRVLVHATESEPIVGISVALRAAVHWASPSGNLDVVSARDAAFGRAEEDLFRLVQVLFGSNLMASADMARTMPHERLTRGTHVFPFSLRLPDRPPSTVLPSFCVPTLGVAVTYTLAAVLERRDAGKSNLVRPLPSDSAVLSPISASNYLRSNAKTKSLHSRNIAQSTPQPAPAPLKSAASDSQTRLLANSVPVNAKPSAEPQYAAPPIILLDPDFVPPPLNQRADSGYAVLPTHELPQPLPENSLPVEEGYAVVGSNQVVAVAGYTGVPKEVEEKPYHAVPPLSDHQHNSDDDDDDDGHDNDKDGYKPIDSKRQRESHGFDTSIAMPETVMIDPSSTVVRAVVPRLRLPEVVHGVKSPRLARPQPVRGISGAHIAATIIPLQCMGARLPTPPRDWQVASAESTKKRLFSRKLVHLEMRLPHTVFVAGHVVNVTIQLDGCQVVSPSWPTTVCTGGAAKNGKLKLRRVVWIRDARPVPIGGQAREETLCDTSASSALDSAVPEGASPRRKSAVDSSMSATHAAEIATVKFNRRQSEVTSNLAVPTQTTDDDDGETRTMTAAFHLPTVLVPSCQSRNVRISYQLHFVLKSRFRSDQSVSLPVKIIS